MVVMGRTRFRYASIETQKSTSWGFKPQGYTFAVMFIGLFFDLNKKARYMRVNVYVEKGKDLFGCSMDMDNQLDFGINGNGTTARKAIEDFYLARDEMKEYYVEAGKDFPELEFDFYFDVGSLFSYYSFLNITEAAKSMKISPMMMRKYAAGISTPSDKRLREIEYGLNALAAEISNVHLWVYRETAADIKQDAKIKELYG